MALRSKGINKDNGPAITEVIKLVGERCNTLVELAEQIAYFYQDFDAFDADAAKKHLRGVAKSRWSLPWRK